MLQTKVSPVKDSKENNTNRKEETNMQTTFNKILSTPATDKELNQIAYSIAKKKNDRIQYNYDNKRYTTEKKVTIETVKAQLKNSNPEILKQLLLSLRITNILSKKVGK